MPADSVHFNDPSVQHEPSLGRRRGTRLAGYVPAALGIVLSIAACGAAGRRVLSRAEPRAADVRKGIALTTHSVASDFPATRHRTLREIGMQIAGGPQLEISTSVLEPGQARLAYSVIDSGRYALLGQSAVYVAANLDAPGRGPFPATGESLIVDPVDRSRQGVTAANPKAFTYVARMSLKTTGPLAVLAVVRQANQFTGGLIGTQGSRAPELPAVGSRAPRVHTDILRSTHDHLARLDTRFPHDDMHHADLAQVLDRRPVVLLFASPSHCPSQLCGPAIDVASSLERRYRDRVVFIHQQVYAPNANSLTAATRAYGLPTQPWLFTIDQRGRIAARLEGALDYQEFDAAIRRALR